MSGEPAVRLRDLPWAAARLARKAWYSVIPIPVHERALSLRGWIDGRRPRRGDHVRANLSEVSGEPELPDLDALVRLTRAFALRVRLTRILPRRRTLVDPRRWSFSGLEHLDAALGGGRGVILAGAHYGYYILLGRALVERGYPVARVMASTAWGPGGEDEPWSRLRRWVHERTRIVPFLVEPGDVQAGMDVRPILAALRENRAVLIAGDGKRASAFAWRPLLGKNYPLALGFIRIAMDVGCPVLPAFAVEGDRPHRIRVEIGAPLAIDPAATAEENLDAYARAFDARLRAAAHLWEGWGWPGLFDHAKEWSSGDLEERYRKNWKPRSRRSARRDPLD